MFQIWRMIYWVHESHLVTSLTKLFGEFWSKTAKRCRSTDINPAFPRNKNPFPGHLFNPLNPTLKWVGIPCFFFAYMNKLIGTKKKKNSFGGLACSGWNWSWWTCYSLDQPAWSGWTLNMCLTLGSKKKWQQDTVDMTATRSLYIKYTNASRFTARFRTHI